LEIKSCRRQKTCLTWLENILSACMLQVCLNTQILLMTMLYLSTLKLPGSLKAWLMVTRIWLNRKRQQGCSNRKGM